MMQKAAESHVARTLIFTYVHPAISHLRQSLRAIDALDDKNLKRADSGTAGVTIWHLNGAIGLISYACKISPNGIVAD